MDVQLRGECKRAQCLFATFARQSTALLPLLFLVAIGTSSAADFHGGAAGQQAAATGNVVQSKGMTWTLPLFVDPKHYIAAPSAGRIGSSREATRQAVAAHVNSDAYKARVQQIVEEGGRGILINAGGPKLVSNLIITLRVLRRHYNCTLPVEVAWQGQAEMDNVTWAALQKNFGPLRGFDVKAVPHPVKSLNRAGVQRSRYTGKVYSLLLSHFREVLMVDADSMFLQHPDNYFNHPLYNTTGNIFWSAAWTDKVQNAGYEMFGLKAKETKEILNRGKGGSWRDTESGQIVIDRGRHLDALEYIFWINSYAEEAASYMWGDKDTFAMGFAAAGKAHLFTQVAVPPGGVFVWRKDMLQVKRTGDKQWGWQLLGVLQYDSWGRPAFLHRTINKYHIDQEPWRLELISAPMPTRWVNYYLAHDNIGPTKGVPWDYVVPNTSFTTLAIEPTLARVHAGLITEPTDQASTSTPSGANTDAEVDEAAKESLQQGWVEDANMWDFDCPVPTFVTYWQARAVSLPVDVDIALERACRPVLRALLGEQAFADHEKHGWLDAPQLPNLDPTCLHQTTAAAGESSTVPPPLAAWVPDYSRPRVAGGDFTAPIRAAYQAVRWLKQNRQLFPILQQRVQQ